MITPWPAHTPSTILVVAGLGRCGTSLLMQMLDAGGIPCVGTFPDYEEDFQLQVAMGPKRAQHWLNKATGHAIKALDPQAFALPIGPDIDYRIIWLDRNPREQAASQFKFVQRARGQVVRAPTRRERKQMERVLARDRVAAQRGLLQLGAPEILGIRFEDLIERPGRVVTEINVKLGGIFSVVAQQRMAECVIPRTANCFDGFLEDTLEISARMLAQ